MWIRSQHCKSGHVGGNQLKGCVKAGSRGRDSCSWLQLHQAVDTRFFIQDLTRLCKDVTESCTPCTSVKSIPKEIHEYDSNEVPEHPGLAFTVDVMKEAKKLVLVAVDNFSSYVTTTFISSEKEPDLRDGITAAITPFMASSVSRIRVDNWPTRSKI